MPALFDQVRTEIHTNHYSIRTVAAFVRGGFAVAPLQLRVKLAGGGNPHTAAAAHKCAGASLRRLACPPRALAQRYKLNPDFVTHVTGYSLNWRHELLAGAGTIV